MYDCYMKTGEEKKRKKTDMARFSLTGGNEGAGPSRRSPKRVRLTSPPVHNSDENRYDFPDFEPQQHYAEDKQQEDGEQQQEDDHYDDGYRSDDYRSDGYDEDRIAELIRESPSIDTVGNMSDFYDEDRVAEPIGQSPSIDTIGNISDGYDEDRVAELIRESPSINTVINAGSKSRSESVSVTLTDTEVLDCPVCYESLKIPVFQCDSGHIACSSCCTKLHNKCPFCCWSIGYIRCRAMENVLESVKVSCQHAQYGCKEKISYCKKDEHHDRCLHAPSLCPIPNCTFFGSIQQLSNHLNIKHSTSTTKFQYSSLFPVDLLKKDKFTILEEEREGSLFVLLNTIEERLGNALTINCIGKGLSKTGFSYDLIAKTEGQTLRFQSVTEYVSGRLPIASTGILLIPHDFTSAGYLKLDICIRTNCVFTIGSS